MSACCVYVVYGHVCCVYQSRIKTLALGAATLGPQRVGISRRSGLCTMCKRSWLWASQPREGNEHSQSPNNVFTRLWWSIDVRSHVRILVFFNILFSDNMHTNNALLKWTFQHAIAFNNIPTRHTQRPFGEGSFNCLYESRTISNSETVLSFFCLLSVGMLSFIIMVESFDYIVRWCYMYGTI